MEQSQGRPTPMPIFNRRKRPLSAMTTFPEATDSHTNNRNTITSYYGAEKMKRGFGIGQPANYSGKQVQNVQPINNLLPVDCKNPAYNRSQKMASQPQPTKSIKFGAGPNSTMTSNKSDAYFAKSQAVRPYNQQTYNTKPGIPATITSGSSSSQYATNQRNTVQRNNNNLSMPATPSKPTGGIKSSGSNQSEVRNDKSIHILSASIADVKRTALMMNKSLPSIMVEIFGTIDSAVTSSGKCDKQFFIKDETDRINCRFYEIDRQMDRIVRGTTYRCVGSYKANKNCIQCVNVRKAADGQMGLAQAMRDLSDKVLTDMAMASRET